MHKGLSYKLVYPEENNDVEISATTRDGTYDEFAEYFAEED